MAEVEATHWLKEAEVCFGRRSLSETCRSQKAQVVKKKIRELITMKEEVDKARSRMYPQEAMWVSAY